MGDVQPCQSLGTDSAGTRRGVESYRRSFRTHGAGCLQHGGNRDRDRCGGVPVYPAIAWYDSRTIEQAEWWETEFGSEFIFSRTGLPILPIFGINKLCWIKQHEPENFFADRSLAQRLRLYQLLPLRR